MLRKLLEDNCSGETKGTRTRVVGRGVKPRGLHRTWRSKESKVWLVLCPDEKEGGNKGRTFVLSKSIPRSW